MGLNPPANQYISGTDEEDKQRTFWDSFRAVSAENWPDWRFANQFPVPANAIEDMTSRGIVLVVPESLKTSTDTEYVRHDNVIGFRDFFDVELVQRRLSGW